MLVSDVLPAPVLPPAPPDAPALPPVPAPVPPPVPTVPPLAGAPPDALIPPEPPLATPGFRPGAHATISIATMPMGKSHMVRSGDLVLPWVMNPSKTAGRLGAVILPMPSAHCRRKLVDAVIRWRAQEFRAITPDAPPSRGPAVFDPVPRQLDPPGVRVPTRVSSDRVE